MLLGYGKYVKMMLLGYGKGTNTKPHNPIYSFSRSPIAEKLQNGQLEEITYVNGEGIGKETKKAR